MQSQVLNQITFSLFFILFFFSWQPKTVFNLLILFPSLFQSDTGTAWIHVMNGRMIATVPGQQQCTSHFRHNYAVVSKKKEGIV